MPKTPQVIAVLVGLMVAVIALVSYPMLAGASINVKQVYGPGPISTFPASWDNPCDLPVHGNRTTAYELSNSSLPQWDQFSLSQVYPKLVNSSAFQAIAAGRTWVTLSWAIVQSTGTGPNSGNALAGSFAFLSGGKPDGYAQVDYVLDTGNVVVTDTGPEISSCGGPPG